MSSSDGLKIAEEKMNDRLLTYTRGSMNSAFRQHLIDDLTRATTEFLELRRQSLLRHR